MLFSIFNHCHPFILNSSFTKIIRINDNVFDFLTNLIFILQRDLSPTNISVLSSIITMKNYTYAETCLEHKQNRTYIFYFTALDYFLLNIS